MKFKLNILNDHKFKILLNIFLALNHNERIGSSICSKGGYRTVYKGKVFSDVLVAVKILYNSKKMEKSSLMKWKQWLGSIMSMWFAWLDFVPMELIEL